jgi:hypothetical protein
MKAMLFAVTALTALAAAPAYAAPDACEGRNSSRQWISIEAAHKKAESFGYAVDEAKRSKGCWKIEGYDRHGAEVEIYFDGESGDVVRPNRWRPPANPK